MFEYDVQSEDSAKRIVARGRIDALGAADVQKLFDRLILAGERILLIDMSDVSYVSSAGLRPFISIQKQLKKAGGEIILIEMEKQVFEVFRMSGLTTVFRIIGKDELKGLLEEGSDESAIVATEIDGVRLEYMEGVKEKGRLFIVGSQEKVAGSGYGEKDVVSVKAAEMQFGCGFAALGERYEEYKGLFGESMLVTGSFFFYPAVRHSSVDFLINARSDPYTEYRLLHGFGFNGPYRRVFSFRARDDSVDLRSLVTTFFRFSDADVLGLVMIVESKGVWGMHLKKVPLLELKPGNGKSIFDGENFSEWVDFPVEPAYANHAVVLTGIAVRDRESVRADVRSLVGKESNFHLHGGIFEKTPLDRDMRGVDGQLSRIFDELQVYRIQHMLGRSTFSNGIAAIIELEA